MKKKIRSKGWFLMVVFGVFLIILGVGLAVWRKGWDGKSDFKLAVISSDNLAVISISPMRDMVNVLEVDKEVMVWIPGGLGWYKADKVKRLLDQEKSFTDYRSIFFYNFGFVADRVVFLDTLEDWDSNNNLVSQLGVFGWIKYMMWQNSVIVGREQLAGSFEYNRETLKEVMMRDFGDDNILAEDMRLSVYNTSSETGLAGFVAERLDWAGFSVMEVSNFEEEIEGCLMTYSPMVEKKYSFLMLKDFFGSCLMKEDGGLSENEIYLYLGDGFSRMLKYSNYVRSF